MLQIDYMNQINNRKSLEKKLTSPLVFTFLQHKSGSLLTLLLKLLYK